MRAVVYARYFTDLQSHASIEDQLRLCRVGIAAEGWSLVNDVLFGSGRIAGVDQHLSPFSVGLNPLLVSK